MLPLTTVFPFKQISDLIASDDVVYDVRELIGLRVRVIVVRDSVLAGRGLTSVAAFVALVARGSLSALIRIAVHIPERLLGDSLWRMSRSNPVLVTQSTIFSPSLLSVHRLGFDSLDFYRRLTFLLFFTLTDSLLYAWLDHHVAMTNDMLGFRDWALALFESFFWLFFD